MAGLAFAGMDYDKAIRCFEQALSIRPDDPRVFFRLGNALFAQQRYAEVPADALGRASRYFHASFLQMLSDLI